MAAGDRGRRDGVSVQLSRVIVSGLGFRLRGVRTNDVDNARCSALRIGLDDRDERQEDGPEHEHPAPRRRSQ
jgi:hypothetical protein